MIDVDKLDDSIVEFEEEVKKIKKINEITDELKENKKKISKIIENSDKQLEKMSDYNKKILDIEDRLKSSEKEIKEIKGNIEKTLSNEFEKILKSNRDTFYEIEKSVFSKIERFNSDIEVKIRDGNKQIQKDIENEIINSKKERKAELKELFENLTDQYSKKIEEQNSKIKIIRYLVIVNILLSGVLVWLIINILQLI
ncbi:MAG: hypothetical protein H0S78_13145 [Tissierellales bacterium]|nr:hypothetical protein [Tissierellales bacterium]